MPNRLLAAGLLALVAATWKLWTPQDVFPQVPLIRAACDWPGWFDWACLAVLVASSTTLLVVGQRGWWSRGACSALAVSLAGFFVLDQHRLQPWAWQFFLLATLFAVADDSTARRGWRWLIVGIYFWSAVSKLDYTFCHEQGPALLGGLKQAMGLHGISNQWTRTLDVVGSLGIAFGELGVAVMLAWPRARWLGLWVATIMHLSLLAALGPFGLNHSLGVLLWNVFFIVQDWLLFSEPPRRPTSPDEVALPRTMDRLRHWLAWPSERNNRLALGGLIAVQLWPSLEPFGYCDHWLAWAVYSARQERVDVILTNKNIERLPIEIRRYWREHHINGETRFWVDLNRWSLGELDAPVYPQVRFQYGICVALSDRNGIEMESRLILIVDTHNRWTGRPNKNVDYNYFIWNASPRRMTFRDATP